MIENKKIEQDLREIDIRIKDLKVNRNCEFGKFALYSLNNGAIMTLTTIPDFNNIGMLLFTCGLSAFNMHNGIMTLFTISDKNKQIRNLNYLKKYLQSYDISKIDIDKLESKIETINKNSTNKSNLEFLKHYLETGSLSHDDMKYKELATKSK